MLFLELNRELSNMGLLEKFLSSSGIRDNNSAKTAINEMKLLLNYCELFGANKNITIEPSLARGLDYYTGVIYEAVIKGNL